MDWVGGTSKRVNNVLKRETAVDIQLAPAGLPSDPISHVCSLTGKYISRKHFTYCPVQICKIMFRRFLFSRIWSSTQDHALLILLLNLVVFFISIRPRSTLVYWRWFIPQLYQFRRGISGGPVLKYFYMIHACTYIHIYMCKYIYVYL